MATKLPRVLLTMKPSTVRLMRRIAKAQGLPLATAITRFLEDATTGLEALAAGLEAAQASRASVAGKLAGSVNEAQQKAADAMARHLHREEKRYEASRREAMREGRE